MKGAYRLQLYCAFQTNTRRIERDFVLCIGVLQVCSAEACTCARPISGDTVLIIPDIGAI